ncbi:MAG TPA: hypothetical protein VJX67_23310, partial [Blastocatellia bacterium]|nr:hypothetical protein [Blastocatellia bacterium]
MIFYIVMGPALIGSAVMAWHLRLMGRHDRVLYRFCEIRREIMNLIRDNAFEMDRTDYYAFRDLLEVVSFTIHDYNACKIHSFNFRRFREWLKDAKQLGGKIETQNRRVLDLRAKYSWAMLDAFFAYTPFLKSEIAVKVLLIGAKALMHLT